MYLLTYQNSKEPLFFSNSLDRILDYTDELTGANEKFPKSNRISYSENEVKKERPSIFASVSYMFNTNILECVNYSIWIINEE
jgi:hypothetical protein